MSCLHRLAFILLIYSSCGVQSGSWHTYNDEKILDIHQKVNDLWNMIVILNNTDRMIYAVCNLQPNPLLNATEPKITGQVLFKQNYSQGKLEADFNIQGFPLDSNGALKAIHIHTFGDLSNGCDSAGGHFNPYSVNHPNHPGDLGNFQVQNGKIHQHLSNLEANLYGPVSVIGRSVVVHKLPDDLGKGNNQASLENGNAGTRLACCVIGVTNKANWEKYTQKPDNKVL